MAATHLILTSAIFNSAPWQLTALRVNHPLMLTIFGLLPLCTGATMLFGLAKRKPRLLKYTFGIAWVYHIFLVALNIINYDFKGTPWLPATFVGMVSLVCYLRLFILQRLEF